jgi:hypothetical protein
MNNIRMPHPVLAISALMVMLTACGGGGLPTAPSLASVPNASRTLMPDSSGDLIYAIGGCYGTCVLSYPSGKLVGSLPVNGDAICSDSAGNVFITNSYVVTEYAHGAQTPTATFTLPTGLVGGCAVDPKTNNLAVVALASAGDIAIFQNEQGTPTYYSAIINPLYCGYDADGNLFVNGNVQFGYGFAGLPNGSTKFSQLSIDQSVGIPGQVQWDGKYITYQNQGSKVGTISRLAVSGSTATVVGTTSFMGMKHVPFASWIYDGKIVVPYIFRGKRANAIGVWKYPAGGKPQKLIKHSGPYKKTKTDIQGVAISVGPKSLDFAKGIRRL